MSELAKKLLDKLEINYTSDVKAIRLNTSLNQRSAGAFSTLITGKNKSIRGTYDFEYGIFSPIKQLLKCPTVETFEGFSLCRTIECFCNPKEGCFK